jgi:glycerol uptake facilitator-like aquaporin
VLTKKLIAEFVGTCFLVMIVVGSGIMAQNLSSDLIIILLANTIATGAGLTALIWIFNTVSGAHFNPAVSLIMYLNNELKLNECIYFISVQFVGGFCGVLLANVMYGLDPIQIAENQRGGLNIYFSEYIATFGLTAVTLSRAFTDTFTGINYDFILPFIIFQLFGALSAMFMMKLIQRDN